MESQLRGAIWVVTIIAAAWAALIYYQKGRNPLYVAFAALVLGAFATQAGLLGFILPFLIVIVARFSGPDLNVLAQRQKKAIQQVEQQEIIRGELKKCPYCAELIRAEATVCRFCSRDLQVPATPLLVSSDQGQNASDASAVSPINAPSEIIKPDA